MIFRCSEAIRDPFFIDRTSVYSHCTFSVHSFLVANFELFATKNEIIVILTIIGKSKALNVVK